MSLLLRAITSPPTAEADARFVRVVAGALTAWATRQSSEATPFTREDVLAHHALVGEIFALVDACLPARFPTVFDDDTVLEEKLLARQAELTRRLEAVRDACELALTAVWTTTDQDDPTELQAVTPGTRYLLERAASERRRTRATELADTLERAAGSELRQAVRQVCPTSGVALSLALLVNRTSADAVRTALGLDAPADVRILVHGPWAPYTFTGSGSISGRNR